MEDHLFGDKEKFVTAAYKKKLQEDQQWLAEEKVREAKEAEYDVVKTGHMGNFYRWGWVVWVSSGLAWIWACRGLYSRRRHVEHLKGWVVSESPVRLCVAGRVQGKDAEQDIELAHGQVLDLSWQCHPAARLVFGLLSQQDVGTDRLWAFRGCRHGCRPGSGCLWGPDASLLTVRKEQTMRTPGLHVH